MADESNGKDQAKEDPKQAGEKIQVDPNEPRDSMFPRVCSSEPTDDSWSRSGITHPRASLSLVKKSPRRRSSPVATHVVPPWQTVP